MNVDAIPLSVFLVGTIALILVSIEIGFRFGRREARRSPDVKESPAAAVGGAVLGLVAFILEPDQREFKRLLKDYLDLRLAVAESGDLSNVREAEAASIDIHRRLWAYAVANGKRDNSDISASFAESVTEVINIHARRVAVALEARIAVGIWIALYALAVLGMLATGYQMGVAGPLRSRTAVILAISFALVITLIVDLDRPRTPLIPVPQKPLRDLRQLMDEQPIRAPLVDPGS